MSNARNVAHLHYSFWNIYHSRIKVRLLTNYMSVALDFGPERFSCGCLSCEYSKPGVLTFTRKDEAVLGQVNT
jgi:hypothetical protein